RRKHKHVVSACFNPYNGFFHHGRFTCARATTNGCHPIRTPQNLKDRFTLLAGKSLVLKFVWARLERFELSSSALNEIDQSLFFSQHLVCREPLMTIRIFL